MNETVGVNKTVGVNGWNFASIWESVAHAQPDHPALIHGETLRTWSQFDHRANLVAGHLLAVGAHPGATVAFYLHNDPTYCELIFACAKASLVHVNTNYRYGPDELAYLWQNAQAQAVVFHARFTPTVAALRSRISTVHTWLWVGDDPADCPEWATDYHSVAAPNLNPNSDPEPEPEAPLADRVTGPNGRSGDDLLLLYTGGTTGLPKGVMWRQDDLAITTDAANRINLPADPDLDDAGHSPAVIHRVQARTGPVSIPACPLMHGTGLFNTLATLSLGGTIVTLTATGFDITELFDTVEARQAKSIFIVGDAFARPMLAALDDHPDRWDISSLRVIISSGVMWSAETKAGLMRHNDRLICVDTYGSSEAIGIGSSVTSREQSASTAKFALSARSAVITEDGRIVTPGSGEIGRVGVAGRVPLGYFGDPVKSAATFPTIDGVRYSVPGDFATVEADGSIVLLGRGSVCINTGGEKVFPEEVEEALKTHARIEDAIVVGVPDERFGQRVVAVVALTETITSADEPSPRSPSTEKIAGEAPSELQLIQGVKDRLAHYKAPRHVLVVPSLERAANGKVDYRRWTRWATDQLSP